MAHLNFKEKIFKIIAATTVSIVLLTNAFAAYGDMDPGTCAPSGIINKAKERMDPKGFWVKMYSDSLIGIETLSGRRTDEQYDGPESFCRIENKVGSQGYIKCMMQERNMLEYWIKCNRHAQIMCRMSGGYC